MTILNRVMTIKYYLMDQKKEVMMDRGVEQRRKRRKKSKGEPKDRCQQCRSRSSEICLFDTGVTQLSPVARDLK